MARTKKVVEDDSLVEDEVVQLNDEQLKPEPAPVKADKQPKTVRREFYTLLINDRVQKLGNSQSPQGDWYYVLFDCSVPVSFGPYPLLVENRGKLETVSGFVQLPILADLVYSDIRRLGLKGLENEPPTPLPTFAGTKMMSTMLHIDL